MSSSERGQSVIMNTYTRFPLVFKSGNGMYITDENDKTYLDFVAGIAVNCLGHANPALTEAISTQARSLIHCSNLYWTEPQITLAEKLIKNSCFDKVFFCNSGAEAVEGALKLARKYGNSDGRYEIITMLHSFHGRTLGAVTATGQTKYQKGFEPLLPGISHVPFNDFDSLEAQITDKTCAILIEPIQGEGGIRPADKLYLQKVRQLCDEKNILLIFDEIQCGLGRTGNLFAYQYYGVEPDACVIAKGLGGGVPIGALLSKNNASVFKPGEHASTFGGNPLACAAGNAVLDALTSGLVQNAAEQGSYLTQKLTALKGQFGTIQDVRGIGLIQGIELSVKAAPIISRCIDGGLLLVGAGDNIIRFVPPLIVSQADIDTAIGILAAALS